MPQMAQYHQFLNSGYTTWLLLSQRVCFMYCVSAKPKNGGVQMAISKVHKLKTFLGIIPRSSVSFIQIVLVDNRTASETGTHAEQVAKDIVSDIAEHGKPLLYLLVAVVHFEASSAVMPNLD